MDPIVGESDRNEHARPERERREENARNARNDSCDAIDELCDTDRLLI